MSTYAHWKLNDNIASTNVINEKGLDGTLKNAGNTSAISEVGKIDRALHLVPTADVIDIGLSSMACDEGSFGCWIKADVATPSTNRYILGRNDAGSIIGDFGFRLNTGGSIQFFGTSSAGNPNFTSDAVLGDTNWHWVVITWNSSVTTMYIDNSVQTNTGAGFILEAHANDFGFGIGNSYDSGTLGWDGLLEDARLYDYILSSVERDFIYNSGSGTYDEYDEDYLAIAHYKCNDDANDSDVIDVSTNAITGEMVNDENNYTSEQSIAGKINEAFTFDGVNDYIKINDVSKKIVEKNLTVAMWFKTGDTTARRMFSFNPSSGAGNIFQCGVYGGFVDVYDGAGHTGSISVDDDVWHWVTYEVDIKNSTFNVYLDNAPTPEITFSFSTAIQSTNLCSLAQEYDSGPSPSDFWIGELDDVRVFNYILTTDSKDFIYNGGTGTESSLPVGEILTLGEGLAFSDLIELSVSNETIEINESLGFGDNNSLDNSIIDESEGLAFSDTIELIAEQTMNESSRIISYNPLVIITDTDPVTIAKVDVSVPASPAWTRYVIDLPGETVTNAKDIKYNDVFDVLYITCADGQLLQVNINDYLDREQIDTGDLNDLINIELISDVHKVYASTDDANGEIILMQDAEINKLNSDLRLIMVINKIFNTVLNLTDSGSLSSDLRLIAETSNLMSTDLRVLATDYDAFDLIKRTDFHVHIDDVETTDVKLDSIRIRHLQEEKSTASFILGRKHDALDVTIDSVASVITNQNNIKIYIKTKLEFEGTIDRLVCDSESESVTVEAIGSILESQRNTMSLPLSTLDTQLHPYDVLLNNPEIYNPVIDPNDENPTVYKGIEIDLGTKIQQTNSRFRGLFDVSEKIANGTWNPRQNYDYFFMVRAELLVPGRDPEVLDLEQSQTIQTMATPRYIGTSPTGLSANIWFIHYLAYWRQRVGENIETELGFYRVGSAPYKTVSATNGILRTVSRWEDRDDGLYYKQDDFYNYEEYVKQFANLEYEKITNISGVILPQTNVDLSLTVDGYLYYSPKLLTRVNITNTTTAGIYKNSNGFPVAIKSVDISSSTMSVALRADNLKSNEELQEIEDRKPDPDDFTTSGREGMEQSKFDVNRWETVQ